MRMFTRSLVVAAALSGAVQAAELADYRDDFSGTPATGWSYLWNAPVDFGLGTMDATTNPLGDSSNYAALQWTGSIWTADGDTDALNSSPDNYLRLHATGGHPGRGSTDASGVGNTVDRAPIAAYTIQSGEEGMISLSDTLLRSANSGHTATMRVLVYVNDTLKVDKVQTGYGPSTDVTFDAELGSLAAGDTVYVAVSPDGSDGSDGFALDFTINNNIVADLVDDYTLGSSVAASTPATSANLVGGWSYLWNAPTDWDGTSSADASTGDITSVADFEPLISSGTRWTADGDDDNGNGSPARFLTSNTIGGGLINGHPGRGFSQVEGNGNDEDRYVIYAYTVDADDIYAITDSTFSTINAEGDGNNVRIFTSLDPSSALFDTTWDGVTDAKFDLGIGELSAGDTIYVAVGVGNNGNDGNDSFRIDFTIITVPTPAALPAGLMLLGAITMRRRS
ncbi:hypothetical protein HED60_08560 [Planctomycetales bacterium ZRK34]|nr:hypothetical protein HED60_08560 [Planctomycetales bacterium ZRK34]